MKPHQFHLLVLASASIGRKHLLDSLKIPFLQFPVELDEESITRSAFRHSPRNIPLILAREKNKIARKQLAASNTQYRYLLTADTIIFTDNGDILGKPKDKAAAFQILKTLMGKRHEVVSASVIWDAWKKKQVEKTSSARVTFRNVSEKALTLYVDSLEPIGKAGGYAIQGAGSFLIEALEGSVATVIGLPLEEIMDVLHEIKNQNRSSQKT